MLRFIFRFILWLLVFYFLWKLLRVLIPSLRRFLGDREHRVEDSSDQSRPKAKVDFKNIQDADFEELPNDDKSKDDGKKS